VQPGIMFFFLLFYSINLICVSISIIIYLNKKTIITNKFSKYNWVNIMACKIKYFDLHLSFNFKLLFMDFFHLLTHIILVLFDYMYA
jgi:hypothetical protein